MMVIVWLIIGLIPIALSLWALLDCARRPAWAWSFAGRSQLVWMGAITFGVFLLLAGMAISLWYLVRVRPVIASIEAGDFGAIGAGLDEDDDRDPHWPPDLG